MVCATARRWRSKAPFRLSACWNCQELVEHPHENFDNGIKLAVKEINAAGGILGRKIKLFDQRHAAAERRQGPRPEGCRAYVVMGPVFSGSIIVGVAETKRAERIRTSSITQQGNPYIFGTSFTQAAAMPKVARYMKDNLKAKTAAVMWVNNDFGKGGREIAKDLEAQGRQGRRRHLYRSGPGRLLRRRAEGQAVERRRAVRLQRRVARACANCASKAMTSRSSAKRR